MKNACPFKVRYKLCPDIKKLAKGNDTTATNKLIRKTKVGTIFANSLRTQNDLQVFLSHSGVSVAIILCSLCTTFAFHFTVTFTDMFQLFCSVFVGCLRLLVPFVRAHISIRLISRVREVNTLSNGCILNASPFDSQCYLYDTHETNKKTK